MAKNQSHFQLRRDTNENWLKANPILKSGEPGFVIDTGALKIGNGVDAFDALNEISGGASNGETNANNVVILDFDYAQSETEGKFDIFYNIAKDEIISIIHSKKLIIAQVPMELDNDIFNILILPMFNNVENGEIEMNCIMLYEGNNLEGFIISYDDENSRLFGQIDAEPTINNSNSPDTIVEFEATLDDEFMVITNEMAEGIYGCLSYMDALAYIVVSNQGMTVKSRITDYSSYDDNGTTRYTFECNYGEPGTFRYDVDNDRYKWNDG